MTDFRKDDIVICLDAGPGLEGEVEAITSSGRVRVGWPIPGRRTRARATYRPDELELVDRSKHDG